MSSVVKLLAIHMVSIDKLKPNPDNPRIHNRKQRRQIAASIRKFGFLFPIIIDNDGSVIAGHGRIAAATDIGMEEVPAKGLALMVQVASPALGENSSHPPWL